MTIRELLSAPESVSALDRISNPLQDRILRTLGRRPAGVLRGSWLGHPVHPMLVTVPLGAWTAAVVLESTLRDHHAARRLIGLGLIGVPPALVTGWADWSVRDDRQRRAGLVHAVGNTVAVAAMLASFRRRKDAPDLRAQALSWFGLAAAGLSGALGGHIAFGKDLPAATLVAGD